MSAKWESRLLGDLLQIQNGYAFDSKRFNADIGPPLIRIRSLRAGVECNTRFDGEFENKYLVQAGDLLVGMDGDFGCYEWKGEPSLLNQRVCRLQEFSDLLEPKFLLYGLNSYLKAIEEATGYTTVKHLSSKQVLSIEFPVPSRAEQQRIVAILDEAFAGIATAKANAERNLRNAREVFDSYLHSTFADGWKSGELVTLSALATDITDGDHMPPPKAETGVPFITIGNVNKQTRKIDFANTFRVPHEYFSGLKDNKRPKSGDVLYTVTGSFGIPVLVTENREFCFQRHIGLIRPNPELMSTWLYYLLMSPQVFGQACDGATGTAQKTVSLKVLRGFRVPEVSLVHQAADVKKLDAFAVEAKRLESIYTRKLTALDELKQSLLHQAFSGQL